MNLGVTKTDLSYYSIPILKTLENIMTEKLLEVFNLSLNGES